MATPTTDSISLGVGDERMSRGRHICYVFSDDDERFRTLARCLLAGVEDGDKLLYLAEELSPEELGRRFQELGADLGPESRLCVLTAAEAFYPKGYFNPEAMTGRLAAFCQAAIDEGFRGARCSGEMSWALHGVPGSERLLEYEAMLNDFFADAAGASMTGICQYDARRFDGPTILGVLEIHPFLLLRGQLLRNPNHVHTGELRQRLRAATAA